MERKDAVKHVLRNINHGSFVNSGGGYAWAPSNVALIKYWGKRDIELNLPVTSSLSISLGNKGCYTRVKQEGDVDTYVVNGENIDPTSKFAVRLNNFLNLFRPQNTHYLVQTETTVPIAAGFASSAAGFASLVLALNQLYDWRLTKNDLSILARLGSGSACRSVFDGFVEWQKGEGYDGMDSYGVKLEHAWPQLRIGALMISDLQKPVSSTEAMQRSVSTSPLYYSWSNLVAKDFEVIKYALVEKDFELFGQTAQNNALAMHALINTSQPPIDYALTQTIEAIAKVKELQLAGVPVFFTQDAGPNLQLLFLAEHEPIVLSVFPEIEVILPFADSMSEQIILVNEDDVEVDVCGKLTTHIQGKLHRAFSVFILREDNGRIELLLQQRSDSKYHSANLWSNTCCGHPRIGEDIKVAAQRRLQEEMGFTLELFEVGIFRYCAEFSDSGLIENEVDHVFVGYSDLDEFRVNTAEVQDCCWVDLEELQNDLYQNPNKYSVWLAAALKILLQYIKAPK